LSSTSGIALPFLAECRAPRTHAQSAGERTVKVEGWGGPHSDYNVPVTQTIDDFESITESAPLVAELRARIRESGPITFREFMQAALYHPKYGYYTTSGGSMSRGGDYVTSPEVHPIFGALVAKQICQFWTVMSCPGRFDVVEHGGGSGLLARDILRWAHAHEPAFARALRYRIVEISLSLREAQGRALAAADLSPDVVEWLDAAPTRVTGCVLSNELIDAFPVHRVVRAGDALREVYVTVDATGRFSDELRPLSDPAIARYFDALGLLPGEGCYAEVNLDAARWISDVAAPIDHGFVLTFDYGYEATGLYAPWRRDGTLLCFYRQSVSSDPYQRIGKQDMTASVDFTTLRHAGEAAGLATLGMTGQSSFLARLGIGDGVASIAQSRPNEMEEYFARRKVVMELIDPARLGRIKVLLQGKDVSDTPLQGFTDDA
jgi:SAM-dependent MidA family methyltransferase